MELLTAVGNGDLVKVKQLVNAGHDVHTRYARYNEQGNRSLLHVSAANGNVEVFQYLIGLGLDPFDLGTHGLTVLQYACGCGQYEMAKFLVSTYPTMKQQTDTHKLTALHCAAASGNVELFEYLVKVGLDINCISSNGQTVLHSASFPVASTEDRYSMVKYIVNKYPALRDKVDGSGYTALHYAAMIGDVNTFRLLVERGMDERAEGKNGENVIMVACEELKIVHADNLDIVTYLAKTYPTLLNNRDRNGRTVLHYTARGENVQILKFLLAQGLDVYAVDKDQRTLFHDCCVNGHYKMVKYLVENYSDLSIMETTNKETPLLLAAREKKDDVIVCLLDKVPDILDNTLLTAASKGGELDYLKTFTAQKFLSLKTQLEKVEATPTACTEVEIEAGRREHLGRWLNQIEFYSGTSTSGLGDELSDFASSNTLHRSLESLLPEHEKLSLSDTEFLNPSMIRKIIKEKGQTAKETDISLQWLCSRVQEQYPDVDEVAVGYNEGNGAEPVLLAFVKEDLTPTQDTLDSFSLVVRKRGQVSDEAKHIVDLEVKRKLQFSPDERARLHKTLAEHSKRLMDTHCNLEIVSASKLKSKGYGKQNATVEEQTCIVLYVQVKGIIPFREKPFPSELDGFQVDVRESRFQLYSDPSKYHDRLLMGCQIASAYGKSGSLGGFLELENGTICCLTSWHLFVSDTSRADFASRGLNREVFQPDDSNPSYNFGQLVKMEYHSGDENSIGVEAALIEVTKPHRSPLHGGFPNATKDIAGFSEDKPMKFTSGTVVKSFKEVQKTCNVVKYGPSTEHTIGILRLSGTAVRKERFTYYTTPDMTNKFELYQQFEIFPPEGHPFSTFGDSGSLVFLVSDKDNDDYDIRALGILVGGTLHNTTIVTPIWAVLDRFSLPMKLLSFSSDASNARTQTGGTAAGVRLETDVADLKTEVTTFKREVTSKFASLERDVASMRQSTDAKLDAILGFIKPQSSTLTTGTTHTSMDEDES